jgi:hypothetical protein
MQMELGKYFPPTTMINLDNDYDNGYFNGQICDWSNIHKYATDVVTSDSDFRLLFILKHLSETESRSDKIPYKLIAQQCGLSTQELYTKLVSFKDQGYIKAKIVDNRIASIRENLFAASIKTEELLQRRQEKLQNKRTARQDKHGDSAPVGRFKHPELKIRTPTAIEIEPAMKATIDTINGTTSVVERNQALARLRSGKDSVSKIRRDQLHKLLPIDTVATIEARINVVEGQYSAMRWCLRGLNTDLAIAKATEYPTTPEAMVERWWRDLFMNKYPTHVCPSFTAKERSQARQLYGDYKESEIKQAFGYVVDNWPRLREDKRYAWNSLTRGQVPDVRLFFTIQNQLMPDIKELLGKSKPSGDSSTGGLIKW